MSFRASFLDAAGLPPLPATEAAFTAAALALFRHQAAHCPPYRAWLAALGRRPEAVQQLADIPFLPIGFFKTHDVRTEPEGWQPQEEFLSSGTTGQVRSRHLVREPLLYRRHAARLFEQRYGPLAGWNILALLPSYQEQGQSSLLAMVDYFAQQTGQQLPTYYLHDDDGLLQALGLAQLENQAFNSKNEALPAAGRAAAPRRTLLFGVSYALLDFAAKYAGRPELHQLTVFETGGMKGRRREMIRDELHQELQRGFGPAGIHSEYGMTELFSQAYSAADGLFALPPALRVLLRDPADPFAVSATRADGAINVIDLANVDSCAFIETKDLARLHPDGRFEVLGRLDNSDVRGCNQLL